MPLPHVHVIFEHGSDGKPFGVAYIRDLLPLSHPVNAAALQVTQGQDYRKADVVIVERMWKPGLTLAVAEQLVERIRADGCRLVYSIDDNLLDLQAVPVPARLAVRYFCRAADAILVSTSALKERLAHLNRRIHLLPNALDERLFGGDGQAPAARAGGKTVIGFMGTFTHDADLMMVLQPLRAALRRRPGQVELQLVGGVSNTAVAQALQALPLKIWQVPVKDVAYPNFVPWMRENLRWDIGIAPLEDTRFNLCKSDIKFLDYSALGIPGIYSRVPSYMATIRHLETGYLAENTPQAWETALEQMLSKPPLRQRLARNAGQYVYSQRSLQQRAADWAAALEELLSQP